MQSIAPIPIIAFGHQSRVGKDTAVNAVIRHVGRELLLGRGSDWPFVDVEKQSFSANMKDVAQSVFGIYGLQHWSFYDKEENQHLRDVPLPVCGLTPLQIWLDMGAKLREIYFPVIVDNAMHSLPNNVLNVFTSLRFTQEGEAVIARGGWCVKIMREGNPVLPLDEKMDPKFPWDCVLHNNGSIEAFEADVIKLTYRYIDWYKRTHT